MTTTKSRQKFPRAARILATALVIMTLVSSASADPITPVTPVSNTAHEESHPRTGLVIAGAVTFGVSYGLAVIAGAASRTPSNGGGNDLSVDLGPKKTVMIPFAGPFMQWNTRQDTAMNCLIAADGVVQIAGAVMFIVGLAWPTTEPKPNHASMQLTPVRMGQGGSGVALRGDF